METTTGKVTPIDGTHSGEIAKGNAEAEAALSSALKGQEEISRHVAFEPEYAEKIAAAKEKIDEIKSKRTELNAEMQVQTAGLVKMGLNKDGIKAAFKYLNMDDDDKDAFHTSYVAVINACGGAPQPTVGENGEEQGDMFLNHILGQLKDYHQMNKRH
ncbi:MAG: hypothetical protein RPU52_02520 [Candidatus Sedimenticola sp. (ex Thyasira tokunagai)]